MKKSSYKIAFFGSSLVSAYWNGAATYYRGIIKALHHLGHRITFFEPDAFERQQHRDMPDPDWAEVVVYQPDEQTVKRLLKQAWAYDIVVKASGVGVLDALLEEEVLNNRQPHQRVIFWDVDAPATLHSIEIDANNPMRKLVPEYDLILTYGGAIRWWKPISSYMPAVVCLSTMPWTRILIFRCSRKKNISAIWLF